MKNVIRTVYPERIIAAHGTENEATLLKRKKLQIGIGKEEVCKIAADGYVILDFGREIVGGVRILSWFSAPNVPVHLRFGESVAETCAELGKKNATNDHALRDFTVDLPQLSDGTYGQTGFRFLRLDTKGEISLKSVVALDSKPNFKPVGKFVCDDERVNQIYLTARDTLFACVQNGYIWDGVKRDRLVWIGDLHPETLGLLSTVGGVENIENCIRLAVEQTPLPGWMNGIPSYSLWWILNLYELWLHTGDLSLAQRYQGYLTALLEQVDTQIDQDGNTHFPFDFLDWPTHGLEDELAGQAGMMLLSAKRAVELSEALGISTAAKHICEKLMKRNDRVRISKQAEAMRVLSGAQNAENGAELLAKGGSRGMSTFMSYYILRALADAGRGKDALAMMKEYYGGMLDRGARTFWEDFSVDWLEGSGRIDELPRAGEKDLHGDYGDFCYTGYRHSFCHGWSCGPIPFLMYVVLGVRVLEAGCRKIALKPDLCGLGSAEGDFPTPYGVVHMKLRRKEDGSTEIEEFSAPPQVELSL